MTAMPESAEKLFQQVCQYVRQTAVWTSVEAALGWDERTHVARGRRGVSGRAIDGHLRPASSPLDRSAVRRRRGPTGRGSACRSGDGDRDRDSDAAVTIRRLKRRVDRKVKLPQRLVEELARTAVLGQQAWQQARKNNDFASFRPLLEKMVGLKREEAEAIGYADCPYDALVGRLRARGADGQREPGACRAAGAVGAAGGRHSPEPAASGHVDRRPVVPDRRAGRIRPPGGPAPSGSISTAAGWT